MEPSRTPTPPPPPPFNPTETSVEQWDSFIGDIMSFNFRMSVHKIDRVKLEQQWINIFNLLFPVLQFVENIVYQEGGHSSEDGEDDDMVIGSPLPLRSSPPPPPPPRNSSFH